MRKSERKRQRGRERDTERNRLKRHRAIVAGTGKDTENKIIPGEDGDEGERERESE